MTNSKVIVLLFVVSMLGQGTFAQSVIKVIDKEGGLPITSVTIKFRDFPIQGITNKNGEFAYTSDIAKGKVNIHHLSYEDTVINLAGPNKYIEIPLIKNNRMIEEVQINTGYQSLPKERSTGSFTTISREKLQQQVGMNILDRISPVANGVLSDHSNGLSGQLMVRGLSTIRGERTPLIVVDNFPYEGDISNINPQDVADITVLKDAAASSIWGARAGNGVIVITTKKGTYSMPLSLDISLSSRVKLKPDLAYIKQMNTSDFIDVEEMLFDANYYNSRINSVGKPALSPVVELLLARKNGEIDGNIFNEEIAKLRENDVHKDFDKYVYRHALENQFHTAINGGNENFAWKGSIGYDRSLTTLGEKSDRLITRWSNKIKIIPSLEFTSDIQYTKRFISSGRLGLGNILFSGNDLYPYASLIGDNGRSLSIAQLRKSYTREAEAKGLLPWEYYPLEDSKYDFVKNSTDDVLLSSGLKWSIMKGLNFEVKYQYERQVSSILNDHTIDSYFTRNLINRYTEIEDGKIVYNIPKGGILDRTGSALNSHNVRGQINYSLGWGENELNILGGSELRSANTIGNSYRTYGYDENILTFSPVNYTLPYKDYISGSTIYVPQMQDFSDKLARYVSVYGNGSYSYKGKYILSASARRDASNMFGVATNKKWNLLWSVGGSWDLGKEQFFPKGSIDYFRVRVTHGYSGNVDPTMSGVTTIRYMGTSIEIPGSTFARPNNYANPDLKWETVAMSNIGVDFGSKHRRISGSLEYYHKRGFDLLGVEQMDITAGVGERLVKNVAEMKANGLDLNLQAIILQQGKFKWLSDVNLSFNKDKVVNYFLANKTGNVFVADNVISGVEGHPVYSMYSFRWGGLDPENGDPRGWLNGEISKDYNKLTGSATKLEDLRYYGSRIPTYFGNMGQTFEYNRFSLSFRLTYKFGYFIRRNTIDYNALFSQGRGHSDFEKRWQNKGDELVTNVPSMIFPNPSINRDRFYNSSEPTVEKGDHIRLSYVYLSYRPKIHSGMSMEIFGNVTDLGIIWRANNKGIDPDVGRSIYSLPNSPTFNLGVRVNLKMNEK